ncbi:6-carboxyhexanoate--CoA ligase [Pollutimonas subterranea]|uniref:6-carboxyhexanoate--CoA ligase n=1 Tax=Pollutimonas subterranea TaxID=2045210 RepID=A0A2N4U5S5_9BURK|nr:acetate--CoA ligase family protein [Pollutimonas subterranea]PLC50372.1 6-carboxyhexanoate--CoA ligase [Pollutimonas subterranea]
MISTPNLDKLFSPRSIAIVGASATLGKIGAMPVTLLQSNGYTGSIYPVNPRATEIQGLPCYSSLSKIEADIDLAIIAVPASHACEALEQARPGQIASAVIFSSGFSETGDEGHQQQLRLQTLAKERQIQLLGPNCLGYMNLRENTYATFSPAPLGGIVAPGSIGMVTQSGAFGAYAYCMARERGLGLSFWISTGNESDVDVADCISWLVQDPHTQVIMAYMEGCKNGDKLKDALSAARKASKPVVITKIGRTQSGAVAAASHTAALAGDDAVYDTLFKQYGAIRAHTIDEFFNIGHALSVWNKAPAISSLGIMSISGGVGALMADEADENELLLPQMPDAMQERLLKRIPFASPRNPVDVTGQAITDPGVFIDTALDMLEAGSYGALTVFLAAAGSSEALWPHIQNFARTLQDRYPDTPLALCALLPPERRHELEKLGCLTFSDPSIAIRTIAAILKRNRSQPPAVIANAAKTIIWPEGNGTLNETDSLRILKQAGVPVVPFDIVSSKSAASAAAAQINVPVVMKIISPNILHKSDMGGVKLNIQGADSVGRAYDEIMASAAEHAPNAQIDGILIAPMVPNGVECIMGMHRDPVFGPVIMFGLGGVFVEILKDVSFRLAPFSKQEALEMIHETRAVDLLKGARGRHPADIDAIAEGLAALSQLAHLTDGLIDSIDVNPFIALPAGQGAMALDALVIRKSSS